MVKLPAKVKVGFRTYKINFEYEHEENDGYCHHNDSRLDISKDLKEGTPRGEVVLHEILHAIFHNYGINTTMPEDEEEKLVNTLGLALTTVIKDNPTAMRWLIKEVTKK